MKLLAFATTLVLAATLSTPGAFATPNEPQAGMNGDCADFNELYNAPVHSPLARVTVDGGTHYLLSHEGGSSIYVDFFNANGHWVGWNERALDGKAPPAAAYGTICIGMLDVWPDLPAPGATWTYQDGF